MQSGSDLGYRNSPRSLTHARMNTLLTQSSPCEGSQSLSLQNPQGFDHAVPASRRHGPLACKGGMGGVLRVEIVVLATPTPILLVRSRDLEDRDLCLLHEAQEPCAIAAGRLDSDALQLSEG